MSVSCRRRASSARRCWRIALTDAWIEKFGGDSLAEMRRNYEAYLATLAR